MNDGKEAYKSLPGVDSLLVSPDLKPLLPLYGKELITYVIRNTLDSYRSDIAAGMPPPALGEIYRKVISLADRYGKRSLRKVFNATGIIIHTNLGRAPFSEELLHDSFEVLKGYNNLEFNLASGTRGNRYDHIVPLLRFLTGAEDILIVNNAAAAVMMTLRTFARGREVIVSRGELIEIGGSFRIPEIMAASDCRMVEVGTTNKTRIDDYRKAVTRKTGLLFKAHKSNYAIRGFTEEVSYEELAELGRKLKIPVLYDIGSGLLRQSKYPVLANEPDVKTVLSSGIDLVCFSGDKLLGGPQAGIIAGSRELTDKLKNEPMLRALRVCKTTLALLETACMYYLNEEVLLKRNMIFKMLNRKPEDISTAARQLAGKLNERGIKTEIVVSRGQCGGGSLPGDEIESRAVKIIHGHTRKEKSLYAGTMYRNLLSAKIAVAGILRQGEIMFDLLTIDENDINTVADVIADVNDSISGITEEKK